MEVILCNFCNGTGKIREDIGTHESKYINYICSNCNGSGRMLYFKLPPINLKIPFDCSDSLKQLADNISKEYWKLKTEKEQILKQMVELKTVIKKISEINNSHSDE